MQNQFPRAEVESKKANIRGSTDTGFEVSKVGFRFGTQAGYVPVKSHVRVLGPILSPSRPIEAPARKLTREHNACWSAIRNVVFPGSSHNLASARASYNPTYKKDEGSEIGGVRRT